MSRIVLMPGQIISGKTLVDMFNILEQNPKATIEPTRGQDINEKDPLKNAKIGMAKRGLLRLFYESLNSPQKEFAGCM